MTKNITNDDSHNSLLQTTDNAFHKICEYDMAETWPNCVAIFTIRAMCRNTANGDCAAFVQQAAVKCDATTAEILGFSLPGLELLQKDASLALTNIDVQYSGTKVQLFVKGKASTTLDWMGLIQADIFYQP